MGESMAWILDILVVAIILFCVFKGMKKGFVKTVLVLAGYIVATLGGFLLSKAAAPVIYDNFLKTKVESIMEDNIDKINIKDTIRNQIKKENVGVEISDSEIDRIISGGGDIAEGFTEYAKKSGSKLSETELDKKFKNVFSTDSILKNIKGTIPDSLYFQIEKFMNKSNDSISEIFVALNNPSKEKRAQEVTDIAVKPLVLMIVQIILFLIIFTILLVIVKIISSFISKTFNLVPLVGPLNKLLGGVLGLLEGALFVFLLALLIKLIVSFSGNDIGLINTEVIEETYLFRHIYNLEIFK